MDKTEFPDIVISAIEEAMRQLIDTFDPEYILLGGSFGKGDWIVSCGNMLLSDCEIVFIKKGSWNRKRAKKIAGQLKEKYKIDFSLSGYSLKRVKNKQPGNLSYGKPGYITLTFFDTIAPGNILYKKPETQFVLPATTLEEVPLLETWRLYVNRLGDYLCEYFQKEKDYDKMDFYFFKVIQAAADSLLISLKLYSSNIKYRYENILKICSNPGKYSLLDIPSDFLMLLKKSLQARNEHSLEVFTTQNQKDRDNQNEIILFWLVKLEKKLFTESSRNYTQFSFYRCDLNLYSNILKLYIIRELWNINFKFYRLDINWRQIVLMAISSLFMEMQKSKPIYIDTYNILSQIVKLEATNSSIINEVLYYWKLLR